MEIGYTRAMVNAALRGALKDVPTTSDLNFGVAVPADCPEVPSEILDPRSTWADKAACDAQARKLAATFAENFRTFADPFRSIGQAGFFCFWMDAPVTKEKAVAVCAL